MKKVFVFIALVLVSISLCFAVVAKEEPITIKQPNGKELTFILKGDERIHWYVTLDGYSLLRNKKGNLVYAKINKEGDMIPSKRLASNKEQRGCLEKCFVRKINKGLFFSPNQVEQMLKNNR